MCVSGLHPLVTDINLHHNNYNCNHVRSLRGPWQTHFWIQQLLRCLNLCLMLSLFLFMIKAATSLQSSVQRKQLHPLYEGLGLWELAVFRVLHWWRKKQWTCTALICSPVSANISWCFPSRHTELKPVPRSKLLLGLHQEAPCQRGGVGWDVNIRLSTGILTKHTACFISNYIYQTNARFALHANETSLVQHSALMNNNNGAVRIISAWI